MKGNGTWVMLRVLNLMLVIPLCLCNICRYKISVKTDLLIITRLLPLGYMFRLSRVIIRPSKEQVQGYLNILCTLGSHALTKDGMIIVKVYVGSYNTSVLNND
jgi:hypothetical protein